MELIHPERSVALAIGTLIPTVTIPPKQKWYTKKNVKALNMKYRRIYIYTHIYIFIFVQYISRMAHVSMQNYIQIQCDVLKYVYDFDTCSYWFLW